MKNLQTKKPHRDDVQKQRAKTDRGNITQIGRDFTQTTNTRISLWISFVFVFAIAASLFLRLFGEYLPGMEVHIEEPVPVEQMNENESRQ